MTNGGDFTIGSKESVLSSFEQGLNTHKTVLALVSSHSLRDKKINPKAYGTHWIIVVSMDANKVKYWEYGSGDQEAPRDQFERSLAGGLVISPLLVFPR